MIEKFDYLEPACPLTGGRAFYAPRQGEPRGRIPVARILEKLDSLFDRNDYPQAGRLLEYWLQEAVALGDQHGELAIQSERIGYFRKQGQREPALQAVERALALVQELDQQNLASGATIYINCATACQAFGLAHQALPLHRRALEIYQRVLSEADSRFGGLYNNMALTLVELGQYAQAEDAYRSALAVMARVPGGEAECAITQINMAYLYLSWGRAGEILPCLEAAYALLQSPALARNGYYAFVLEKCAPAFAEFGQEQRCREMEQEAEKIYAGS